MYIKQIPLAIYSFNDVIKDASLKDKVLDLHRYINVDDDFWYKDILKQWDTRLNQYGFINTKIYFTGFYSQGDGACFECNEVDFKKLLTSLEKTSFKIPHKKLILRFLENYCTGEVARNHYGNLYCHSNSRNFILTFRTYKTPLKASKLLDAIASGIDKMRKSLSDEIYKELEDTYIYFTSDEAILETLKINEYEFLEDGKIA